MPTCACHVFVFFYKFLYFSTIINHEIQINIFDPSIFGSIYCSYAIMYRYRSICY